MKWLRTASKRVTEWWADRSTTYRCGDYGRLFALTASLHRDWYLATGGRGRALSIVLTGDGTTGVCWAETPRGQKALRRALVDQGIPFTRHATKPDLAYREASSTNG